MPDPSDNPSSLDALRGRIDEADAELLPAFIRRMEAAVRVADFKLGA